MERFIAIADIHNRTSMVRKLCRKSIELGIDTIVVAGDITHFNSLDRAMSILYSLLNTFKKVLFIPGNCDPVELLNVDRVFDNVLNIHNRLIKLDNMFFYGIGGSNKTPFNTWIEFSEEELNEYLLKAYSIPCNQLVMVTHAPPYNTLDKTFIGLRVGVKVFKRFIEEHGAKLWITGHVHEARGVIEYSGTKIVNPGALKNKYYALIEIDEDVIVKLNRL